MEIYKRDIDGKVVIDVLVDLDLYNAPTVLEQIDPVIQEGAKLMVLNLGKLSYVDSKGLATLIGLHRKLEAMGGQFRLCGAQAAVQKVFKLTKIDALIKVCETEEDAIASFT